MPGCVPFPISAVAGPLSVFLYEPIALVASLEPMSVEASFFGWTLVGSVLPSISPESLLLSFVG